MQYIRILDEKPLMANELINQEKVLSKSNTSCASKAEYVNLAAEDFTARHRKRILEKQRQSIQSVADISGLKAEIQPTTRKEAILDSSSCDYPNKKSLVLPELTQKVRKCSDTELEGLLGDGYNWRKYGLGEILGVKNPRSYYRCSGGHVDQCQATLSVQQFDVDPSMLEVTYHRKHSCTQALHPILNLSSPNELNQNGLKDEEFFDSSDFIHDIAKDFDIQELKSSSSSWTQAFNPIPDLPPPNEQNQQEILSHSNSKGCATTNPGTQSSQFQNQSETSKSKAETILMDMITRDACNPSTDPPQSNLEVEVGISYGKAIAPNVVTADISSAASPPTGSPRSNPEVEVGIMGDITSAAASTPSKGSPRHIPEVEVGISCGNIIAPNEMRGGFHNHIDDQDKQVQRSDANQTQFNSEILQVNETATNVVVITDETLERKMDGKGKGSASTNPRIESKPKSRHCCWFRCFCRCHCHIGVME